MAKNKDYKVKGIVMSASEFNALIAYLNRNRVQRYTKSNVSDFLEAYHTNPTFKRAYSTRKR